MKVIRICLVIFILAWTLGGIAQNIPPKPNPPKLVNDQAGVLSADEEARLEQKLVAYDDSTSNQVVILTIRTLDNYPIEEYALRVFREWGIGNKTTNNGVLIVAAIEDRQIRIEVGYGLEGAIPDITANQIINSDIRPNFRSNDYYNGLEKASESIIKAAAGEYQAPAGYRDRGREGEGSGLRGLIIAAIVIIFILANINRRGGGGGGFMSRRGYRGLWGPTIFGSMLGSGGSGWGGGGGGWSGGGGGFGGFGGGNSGGGGASGSW